MSEIREFKCQQCGYQAAIDTVFNFEVCPKCRGNFFPVDYVPPVDWKDRAEKAESIIRGMFPMWIAAMDYCGHGGAASLDRMKNYYNGRSNRLTVDETKLMLDIVLGKEEK